MNDKELIQKLGGPAKLAKALGFGRYGQQRVTNWMTRGIPAEVKVQFPHLFMQEAIREAVRSEGRRGRKQKEAPHA